MVLLYNLSDDDFSGMFRLGLICVHILASAMDANVNQSSRETGSLNLSWSASSWRLY